MHELRRAGGVDVRGRKKGSSFDDNVEDSALHSVNGGTELG